MANVEDHKEDLAPTGAQDSYPSQGYAWYVVGVLMIVYVFSFIDRQILALLVGPIRADLGISDSQMSYLMGFSFALFYTIFGIPMGRLADSKSRRVIIAGGLAVWSFMSVGCGVARNYVQLLAMRVGVGVGEATLSPSAYSLITDYFPPKRLALALSIYGAGIYIGSGIAFLAGGYVVEFANARSDLVLPIVGETRPWQLVFFVIGLPGLAFVGALATIREPLRRGISKAKAAGGGLTSVPISEVVAYIGKNWPTFLCHNVGFAFLSFIGYGSAAWIPTFFVRTFDWNISFTGKLYGTAVIVFGTAGIIYGGQLAAWLAHGGYRHKWARLVPVWALLGSSVILFGGQILGGIDVPWRSLLPVYATLALLAVAVDFALPRLLAKGGHTDSKMRAALVAAVLNIPFALAFPLMPGGYQAYVLLCTTAFLLAMPFGVAPAAIQEMMPNQLRGQASAIYLFVVNLIGLGLGPSAVAWCTDYLFKDDMMIRYSLMLTGTVAGTFSSILLFVGLRHFRRSMKNLDDWHSAP